MTYMIIGLVVGTIMGLTGAGGALISIPLFITLLQVSLKDATVLSLVAVMLGTSVNLIGSFKKVDLRTFISFTVFGIVANMASFKLKTMIPDMIIGLLLTIIGGYSVWSIWQSKKTEIKTHEVKPGLFKVVFTGISLGLITTFTGLGGGVVLVPILTKFFGKSYQEALPTSLATIFSISFASFIIQTYQAGVVISLSEIFLLGAGSIIAFLIQKLVLKTLSPERLDWTRRIVFTLVVLYSITNILLQSF